MMKESDPTPQILVSSLQPSRYGPQTGKVISITLTRSPETKLIFYAGKEACA